MQVRKSSYGSLWEEKKPCEEPVKRVELEDEANSADWVLSAAGSPNQLPLQAFPPQGKLKQF